MANIPTAGRHLTGYFRRADELQNHQLNASYYCRVYATKKLAELLPKNKGDKDFTNFVMQQLDICEKNKSELQTPSENDFRTFCQSIFENADKEDRSGNITKKTMIAFLCASQFFEVLTYFGNLSEEDAEKKQYCRYKAAYLKKCFDSDETPIPGPPNSIESPPTKETTFEPMPETHDPVSTSFTNQSCVNITAASKHTKLAMSALTFEDVETAVVNLKEALTNLGVNIS